MASPEPQLPEFTLKDLGRKLSDLEGRPVPQVPSILEPPTMSDEGRITRALAPEQIQVVKLLVKDPAVLNAVAAIILSESVPNPDPELPARLFGGN